MGIFSAYRKGVGEIISRRSGVESFNTPIVGQGLLSTRFDSLFRKYGEKVPVEYLRALAYSESKFNPVRELEKEIDVETSRTPEGKKDSYWGLFQVGIKNVLADYNERHGTNIQPIQLFDPDINTRLASDTLNRIVNAYQEWSGVHGISELAMNWQSPEYVKLVTAGWNSGYSRGGGVQKVAKWLKEHGLPVTHDNVYLHGAASGATKFLDGAGTYEGKKGFYDKKRKWQAAVTARYFRELGRVIAEAPIEPTEPPRTAGGGGGVVAGVLLLLGGLALVARG